jgi:hypothetical protein
VTLAWLALGGLLTAGFVGLGAALPRPQAEVWFPNLFTPDQDKARASRYAVSGGEPGEGEGRSGAQKRDPEGAPAAGQDKNAKGSGGKGQAKGQGSGPKQQQAGSDNNSGKDGGGQRQEQAQAKDGREQDAQAQTDQDGSSGDSAAPADLVSWVSPALSWLKWILFGILALITVFFILRGGLRYLSHFTEWARRLLEALRRFWEGLFGSPRWSKTGGALAKEDLPEPPRRPFSEFSNPFLSGRAARMTPAELARYCFETLEAWAWEHDNARRRDESPIEFTVRLVADVPELDREAQAVGFLYSRVLYATGELPAGWSDALKKFWTRLDALPAGEVSIASR